ncbi:MAG: tetratricopeptide repeat protein [Gammaproteobacteria bacterium]|nr:tetratricopeptide repeat protein [Gammaproteobacteria bacterium]
MGYWVTSAGRVSVMPAGAARWTASDVAVVAGLRAKKTGRLSDAEEALRKALQIDTLNIQAMHSLGVVLRARGKLDEAASVLYAAAALEPDSWAIWNDLGLTREQQGRLYQARHIYRRAAEIPGAGPGPAINHANILIRLNRTQEAITAYRAVMERAPERAEAAINLATVLEKSGQLRPATAVVREGLIRDRRNPALNLTAARLERRAKRHPGAIMRLRKILDEERPPAIEAAIQAELGLCHDALGEMAEAMIAFTRANRLMRREARALIHDRAQIFETLKQCSTALERRTQTSCPVRTPLFVVGIPGAGCSDLAAQLLARTGATILEDPGPMATIHAAWPKEETSPEVPPPDQHVQQLRRLYFDLAAEQSGRRDGPIIDISTANLLRMDIILTVFPSAQTALMVRHPADLALACLARVFQPSAISAHFHTLTDILKFLEHAEPLTHRLAKQLGENLHLIRYETLAEEPDRSILELLAFAGIEAAAPATQCSLQLEEGFTPGRWNKYWPWLEEHAERLRSLCKTSGYPLEPRWP